jgi:glycosyltransferase involved in cell wall biosynthesis
MKHKAFEKNKITVVTVVYNGEKEIEETIQSVITQTYPNIEYIVIDGASTDNTLDIIKKYSADIDTLVSEPDRGIYDAMNKAIGLASGEWIIFMNAGDTFASEHVLENIFGKNDLHDYDVVYGNNYYKGEDFCIEQKCRDLTTLYKGMAFNHQSSFVKSSLMKEHMFDPTWKIQCEYDLFLKLYLGGHKFRHVDEYVAVYRDGGFSEQNTIERTLERWLINLRHKQNNVDRELIDRHYNTLLTVFIDPEGKKPLHRDFKFKLKKIMQRLKR